MATKFETAFEACKKQLQGCGGRPDIDLLQKIAKGLGPALYKADASVVATSQKSEIATIKKNFLIKKLGCEDGPKLDKAIETAIEKIGKSNRRKLRAVFYYFLVKALKKSSVYA